MPVEDGKTPSKEKVYRTVTRKEQVKVGEKTVTERSLGAMVSMLVKATQELMQENKELSQRLNVLEGL